MAQITRKPVDPGVMIRTGTGKGQPRMASFAELAKVLALRVNGGGSGGGSGLTTIADKSLFANISGGAAVPIEHTLSAVLDAIFGSAQGDILYRAASLWAALAPGTANYILATGGPSANPAWVPPGGATGDGAIARFVAASANPGFDPSMIYNASITLSNSNKTATPVSSSPYNYAYGTTARYTGKRYWEVVPGSTSFCAVGATGSRGHIVDLDVAGTNNFGQRFIGNVGWSSDGKISASIESVGVAVLATYATWSGGNVLSFALDIDALLMWFRVGSGNWNNNASADPATGTLGLAVPMLLSGTANGLIWPGLNMGNASATTMHLLAADFAQTVPSGFSAWAA